MLDKEYPYRNISSNIIYGLPNFNDGPGIEPLQQTMTNYNYAIL